MPGLLQTMSFKPGGRVERQSLASRSGGKFEAAKAKAAKLWAEVSKEPFEVNLDVALIQEASESNRQSGLALAASEQPG